MATATESSDVAPAHDLTQFQSELLYLVEGLGDAHGLALKDEMERYYPKEVHHGRLYPNLDTLVEKGLVDKSEVDGRTNQYTTTERGRRALADDLEWRQNLVQTGGEVEEGEA